MVNPEITGRTFPPTEPYIVGREKIREFAKAVRSTNELNLSPAAARAAGYEDVIAPPTFVVIISQRAEFALIEDDQAQIDFAHLVHGDQRFIHERPIAAGDELTAQLTVTRVKTLGAHTMLGAETKITDGQGELVCTAIASFVIRGDSA